MPGKLKSGLGSVTEGYSRSDSSRLVGIAHLRLA